RPRDDAVVLLQTAQQQPVSGPVLRTQIARLTSLLPALDKPVRLSLVSDNLTQVTISSVGSFGSFARRDIELKPGRYTVIGTRDGYREVRRDITVSPGEQYLTVNVSCSEAIWVSAPVEPCDNERSFHCRRRAYGARSGPVAQAAWCRGALH